MSPTAPELATCAPAVGRKGALKPPSSHLDLQQNSQDMQPTSRNLINSLDIFLQLRRKFPAKGIALVFLGLAFYSLIMYLPTFNYVVVFPCGRNSSCSLTKLQSLVSTSNSAAEIEHLAPDNLPTGLQIEHLAPDSPTDLRHIVFCIASTASSWNDRQEYVKLWWQPPEGGTPRRGFVWLDKPIPSTANLSSNEKVLPDVQISGKTDNFLYTWQGGTPSAIRVSRMVSETFRLRLQGVRWFILGDDDTIFFPENLAAVLQQYDHEKFYYIGQASESQRQSALHSFGMAFGGGGMAISYALVEAMEKMQDNCLSRYPNVYGSDSRMEACIAELGVPLTTVKGFHQIDIRGDVLGFLAAHPVAPLVSLHHIDSIDPIFPDKSRVEALRHLVNGAIPDSAGILQQSICYDISRNITFSVSWGYAVQIFAGILTPLEVQKPALTFMEWRSWQRDPELFKFDIRSLWADPCGRQVIFFMETVKGMGDGKTAVGIYRRRRSLDQKDCGGFIRHDAVEVYKQRQSDSWFTAPRRQYCEVIGERSFLLRPHSLRLQVRDFKKNEIIAPQEKR